MIHLRTFIDELDRLFHPIAEHGAVVLSSYGIRASSTGDSSKADSSSPSNLTISLSGQAGTGKSILTLHFAAGFLQSHPDSLVLYISTDLSADVANTQFASFGLAAPRLLVPDFVHRVVSADYKPISIRLEPVSCSDLGSGVFLSTLLSGTSIVTDLLSDLVPNTPEETKDETANGDVVSTSERLIHFVDLQENASGDDWNYLERFFSESLPILHQAGYKEILIAIDAIEGLDTPDAGELPVSRHGRRQRLATLLETTGKYASMVFSLEVTDPEQATDEEFVSDVAIHLRKGSVEENPRITLEIAKARGMFSYSGAHELQILGTQGSYTDKQPNQDDLPRSNNAVLLIPNLSVVEQRLEHRPEPNKDEYPKGRPKESTDRTATEKQFARFNIRHLDDMLDHEGGLPAGKIHAIIGEENTHRSGLAMSFLAESCYSFFETFFVDSLLGNHAHVGSNLRKELRPKFHGLISKIRSNVFGGSVTSYQSHIPPSVPGENHGVAVLFGAGRRVRDLDFVNALNDNWIGRFGQEFKGGRSEAWSEIVKEASKFTKGASQIPTFDDVMKATALQCSRVSEQWLKLEGSVQQVSQSRRLFYRRLPNRPISKDLLYSIIATNIKIALIQQIILDSIDDRRFHKTVRERQNHANDVNEYIDRFLDSFPTKKYGGAWKVRVAFEDISSSFSTLKTSDERNALIAALVDLCRLLGVTALFVDTERGGPLEVSTSSSGKILRARADTTIYTWHVPYGGGSTVAITAMPPISDDKKVVVRELCQHTSRSTLYVDRRLELYLDVLPRQAQQMQELSRVPLTLLIAGEGPIYKDRSFEANCQALLHSCLGSSHESSNNAGSGIIQVVPMARKDLEAFVNYNLLTSEPRTIVAMVDEHWSQETKPRLVNDERATPTRFLELDRKLIDSLYSSVFERSVLPPNRYGNRRLVPFTWNFGLSLIHQSAWTSLSRKDFLTPWKLAHTDRIRERIKRVEKTHEVICRRLDQATKSTSPAKDRSNSVGTSRLDGIQVHWHDYLSACEYISQAYLSKERLKPFEIDMPDVQSLLCFILEVWFSTYVWYVSLSGPAKSGGRREVRKVCIDCLRHFSGGASTEKRVSKKQMVPNQPNSLIKTIHKGLEALGGSTATGQGGATHSQDTKSTDLVLCLYLTLEMLSQVVDFSEWSTDPENNTFTSRVSTGRAIAGRYWYTTASSMLRSSDEHGNPLFNASNPLIPVSLPGFFSSRGDWHLAVLASSRSTYLGELAIQELTRTKATIFRMQSGVGLPMIQFGKPNDPKVLAQIRSAIPSPNGGPLGTYHYGYIRSIAPLQYYDQSGINSRQTQILPDNTGSLFALFRSDICDYLKENTIVAKALCRLLSSFSENRKAYAMTLVHFQDMFGAIEKHILDRTDAMESSTSRTSLIELQLFGTKSVSLSQLRSWRLFKEYLGSLEDIYRAGESDQAQADPFA